MRSWWKRLVYVMVIGSAIGILSEQRSCASPALTLPATVAEWKLAPLRDCAKPVPQRLRIWNGTLGARQACRAEYAGPVAVTFTLYDMPDTPGATAFDALQKSRTEPGKMAFFKGHYFGVAESPAADMATLNRFVMA